MGSSGAPLPGQVVDRDDVVEAARAAAIGEVDRRPAAGAPAVRRRAHGGRAAALPTVYQPPPWMTSITPLGAAPLVGSPTSCAAGAPGSASGVHAARPEPNRLKPAEVGSQVDPGRPVFDAAGLGGGGAAESRTAAREASIGRGMSNQRALIALNLRACTHPDLAYRNPVRGLSAVVHDLDVVAVGVEDEGAVVAGVVPRALAGGAVVAVAGGERRPRGTRAPVASIPGRRGGRARWARRRRSARTSRRGPRNRIAVRRVVPAGEAAGSRS